MDTITTLRWSWLTATVLCLWMSLGSRPSVQAQTQENSDIAVLKSRVDAVDKHLVNTDDIAVRLWAQINDQEKSLAEMQGEERAAFAMLTLLTAGNFVVQLRKRREL